MPIDLDTDYVSPADIFLAELDKQFSKPSRSQRAEKEKFAQLNQRRDKAIEPII